MRLKRVAVDSGELDSALAKSLTMSTFFLQWYAGHIYLISYSHFASVYLVPSWYIRKSFSSSHVHIALKACLYNTNSVEKVLFHGLVRCFSVGKKKRKNGLFFLKSVENHFLFCLCGWECMCVFVWRIPLLYKRALRGEPRKSIFSLVLFLNSLLSYQCTSSHLPHCNIVFS